MTRAPILVDARGHRCPVPSLRLRKAIEAAGGAGRFRLLATDPMARIDVPYLIRDLGGEIVTIEEFEGALAITVAMPGAPTG